MTPREERAAAQALTVPVAWPTLALAAGLVVFHLGLIALALSDLVPLWAAVVPLGVSAYAHYTLVHESVHGNVVRGSAPAHAALGWYGSLVLGLTWPVLRRTHQQHHSHTNAEADPDRFVHGSFCRVLLLALRLGLSVLLPWVLLRRIVPDTEPLKPYLAAEEWMTTGERRVHYAVQTLLVGTVWGLMITGFWAEVLALYVLPGLIGRTLLMVLFQWWPHRPFEGRGRYDATRYGYLGSEPLWLAQNLHLMHHLWPAVPWYNYARLRRALAPVLAERGAIHRPWRAMRAEGGRAREARPS